MPFEQALAAAGGGGVLGDEYRVAAHRRLPAVVGDFRRRQPLTDKIFGMPADGVEPFLPDIGNVRPSSAGSGCGKANGPDGKKYLLS